MQFCKQTSLTFFPCKLCAWKTVFQGRDFEDAPLTALRKTRESKGVVRSTGKTRHGWKKGTSIDPKYWWFFSENLPEEIHSPKSNMLFFFVFPKFQDHTCLTSCSGGLSWKWKTISHTSQTHDKKHIKTWFNWLGGHIMWTFLPFKPA